MIKNKIGTDVDVFINIKYSTGGIMKKTVSLFLAIVFIFAAQVKSQDLQETLSGLSSDAASAYVNPIISGFGSNLNSGWVSRVPTDLFGFHFGIKIIAMGSMFGDEDKTFNATGSFRFTDAQAAEILANSGISTSNPFYSSIKNELLSAEQSVTFTGPTIVGSDAEYLNVNFPGATIQGQNVAQYNLTVEQVKGYLKDLSFFHTVAPQLNVGTVFGTNASFRYLPSIDLGDLGKFEFFGFGLIHNPSAWLKMPLPVDLGVGFFTQSMKVGDVFETSATQYGIFASRTFGAIISFTPYASLTLENSTTTVSYDYNFDTPVGPQTSSVKFDLEGKNGFGATVGIAMKLIFLNVNVDYKMSDINTISAGLSFFGQ